MSQNKLKLNANKTEVMVMGTPQMRAKISMPSISVNGSRIEFKILLLTFKGMQGCGPLYLRELSVKQANTRTLRSNTKNLLQIPLTNLKRWFGDRAFCAYAPRRWNELPDNIKAADSVQNFKKQLKTLLFRKEFN